MATLLDRIPLPVEPAPLRPDHRTGERLARRALRDQIARLERDLGSVFDSAYPRDGFVWSVPGHGGPRVLALGELEVIRDELADRLSMVRNELSARAETEEGNRRLIEYMMLEPGRYKFVRVTNADIGERGCKQWHVRPRLGLIGMLMDWWHVKISSGCPLAKGSRTFATPPPP